MRRITQALALACCAVIAACSGGGSGKPGTEASLQKGVYGQHFFVNLTKAALVGGAVTSADGRINCGSTTGATSCGDALGQTQYAWGSTVVLTATADTASGYSFQGWAGDCVGGRVSGATCTITNVVDATVVAAFSKPPPIAPDPTAKGRVYGYVKDGGVGVAGVTVSLGSATARTNANGAYVLEVAPGTYQLSTVASAQYDAAALVDVLVPVRGSCNVAGSPNTAPGFPKQGFWAGTPGCLVRQNDIGLVRAATFVAPAPAPTITTVPAMPAVVGFEAPVQVGCGADGVVAQVSGPTTLALGAADASGNVTFTTPTVAEALAAVPLPRDDRPGFLSINQAQAAALTYTLSCTTPAGTSKVKVPLVAAVNANLATALRAEPLHMPYYRGNEGGMPGVAGPLWAAGAETRNDAMYTGSACWVSPICDADPATPNPSCTPPVACAPDGGPWRAHAAVDVSPGTVLILDGPANANWKFCSAATDSYTGTCGVNANATTANNLLKGNGTGYAWLFAGWTAGGSVYLTGDALSRNSNGFVGEPNIQVQAKLWGGWDQRDSPGVESCAGCHLGPGEVIGTGPIDFVCRNAGPTDPCYELGPVEPSEEWMESKHSKALVNGAANTHFTLEACGGCHATGFDRNLPSTNNGFSTRLGSYVNDFLFEGNDATVFLADLAVQAPAAAKLANVQCTSCHGPTPNNPNHTASLNAKVCGTCHNGHDPQFEQWSTSMHANLAGAIAEGPAHGRDQTHCARCHFAQGYFLYAEALKSGNPDSLGNLPPAGAPAGAKTAPLLCADAATATTNACPTTQRTGLVTAQNIDPISCQTCHDPHSLEVRIKPEDTANGLLLAGGFRIYNAGAGGLCAGCHNSRNGIIGATPPNYNAVPPTPGVAGTPVRRTDDTPLTSAIGLGTPHSAAQADVYFAGNGYLLCNDGNASGPCTLAKPNYHRDANFFADTCAECHVKRLSTATAGTPSNHTFAVDAGTCASCHGAGNELANRQTAVAAKLSSYLVSLTNVLKGAGITRVTGTFNAVPGTVYTVPADVTISSVAVVSASRQMALTFTFSNGDVVSGCGVNNVMAGTVPVLYALSDPANPASAKVYGKVVKSMYDKFLIDGDASSGVHNMAFVDAMLDAMVNDLDSPGLPK